MGKRPFYRKVRRTLYETVSDSGNSVLRYRGHDDKEYYVASSNDPNVGPGGGMIEVTWQELKNKRDAGELTPGCLYRITDYQCTTTQENTRSAGHQFDIVLLALSEDKLAEEGWAMHHANDTYFANSNLSAWKVWYCLDNDKSRFAWADYSVDESIPASITINRVKYNRNPQEDELAGIHPYAWKADTAGKVFTNEEEPFRYPSNAYNNSTGGKGTKSYTIGFYTPAHEGTNLPNGRGVIYRLIDEWGNDVPYDFKNLLIHNDTYNEYLYAIADFTNLNEDPTLNGTKVNSIHVLSNNNNVLKPVAVGGFVNNPLTNIILLNNSSIIGEIDNCVVSNGNPI